MDRLTIETTPIEGQKPGTSGLRKSTRTFMSHHFLENYTQAIFDGIGGVAGKTLVLGGDGRFFNDRAIQVILRMAAANGVARMIVGQNGILSTPAASNLIIRRKTDGGLILSASHNPGGIDADFGLKYNTANGGPAPEDVTGRIYSATQSISRYFIVETSDVDLSVLGTSQIDQMAVEVIDPVTEWADLMETLFDFDAIRALIASGFTIRFDAMHAVTGPYAQEIFLRRLGAPEGTVLNGKPSPDFGGGHPDPNPIWAKSLVDLVMGPDAPDFAAASDGDGDRNMILGKGICIAPSDSLAVLAANAHLAPAYKGGLAGVARSMPTSRAVDRVAAAKGLECFETPTGWKFFGNLLDAGRITICGEESAGTSSDHVREKDGLWAVLLWLNILAARKIPVLDLVREHWTEYGRNYYARYDFEAIETDNADRLFSGLRDALPGLVGTTHSGKTIETADEFSYHDPVDGSVSNAQGLRLTLSGGSRIVFRLSGTGTVGATLRVYLEELRTDPAQLDLDQADVLAPLARIADEVAGIARLTGRTAPDVIA